MKVNCPQCKSPVEWSPGSLYRPFCSKRCQLIDLGEWADEQKALPCGENKDQQGMLLPDIEDIEAMLADKGDDFFRN